MGWGAPQVMPLVLVPFVEEPWLPTRHGAAYEEYKHDFGSWCSDAYVVKSADMSMLRETIRKILG